MLKVNVMNLNRCKFILKLEFTYEYIWLLYILLCTIYYIMLLLIKFTSRDTITKYYIWYITYKMCKRMCVGFRNSIFVDI